MITRISNNYTSAQPLQPFDTPLLPLEVSRIQKTWDIKAPLPIFGGFLSLGKRIERLMVSLLVSLIHSVAILILGKKAEKLPSVVQCPPPILLPLKQFPPPLPPAQQPIVKQNPLKKVRLAQANAKQADAKQADAKDDSIYYIDRVTGKRKKEKVYGETVLRFLYGDGVFSQLFGAPLRYLLARFPIFSSLYGWWQKGSWTRSKIAPFIRDYAIDSSEFRDPPASFGSFNDFFIRKLKPEARPIASGDGVAVIPADGRYLFYPDLTAADGFVVKGKKFNLATLLESEALANEYQHGAMVIARLCPTDYHRFHFPFECVPTKTRFINGWLYSVNPMAIKRNIDIFTENKRTLCELNSETFGKVLYLEIGATTIGSIQETYTPDIQQQSGGEKGYFSFGASTVILLFPKGSLKLASDLAAFPPHVEVRCLMGQKLGSIK